jgi:hypothetical protein
MLPMGEGPFPYARDSLYFSKPVRPFSWPVCPHSFNARTAFSLKFVQLRNSQSFRYYCKNLSYSPGFHAGPAIGSIHEPSHADVHYHSKRQERKQNRRAPITHQRQWDTGHRHESHHHSNVDQNVERQHRYYTHDQERTCPVWRRLSVMNQTHQHQEV